MPGKIFISYRRDDSAANALSIGQYLAQEFGRRNVFIDVDITAGANFPSVLEDRLAECKVLLAVIGPNWLDIRDEAGNRRLDDPEDWVRLEIVRALKRGITVIPVLIGGAKLPSKRSLPEDLWGLLDHQSAGVTTSGFRNEMGGLARDIRTIPNIRTGKRIAAGGVVVAALMLAGWIGLGAMGVPVWLPWSGPPKAVRTETAAAPEPERTAPEVDGESRFHIVRRIRCETREAIRNELLLYLRNLARGDSDQPGDKIAQNLIRQYDDDPEAINGFNAGLFPGARYVKVRELFNTFADIGIAYAFDFGFMPTDTFGGLINVNVPVGGGVRFCDGFLGPARTPYAIGISKLVHDFVSIWLFATPGSGTPTPMVDNLTYATGGGPTDTHTVTIALAISPTAVSQRQPGRTESGPGGAPSERLAVMAIEQFKSRRAK